MTARKVHGDDLLYRFFVSLLESEPEASAVIPKLFVESMAIWLPLDVYQNSPVLLPWVVRDPACRGNKQKGLPDQWGSPNNDGYLRDDNSLVKALPRSLDIRGPRGSRLNGKRIGTEFVAAHIWRNVGSGESANRIPLLNTFVPNLVWLPSQIAKLSDLDGGIVQNTLKEASRRIYGSAAVGNHLRAVVSEAWSLLPAPKPAINVDIDVRRLNWFASTDRFMALRMNRLRTVTLALETLAAGETLTHKVITTRYTEGLPKVPPQKRKQLNDFLSRFIAPERSAEFVPRTQDH